MRFVVFWLVVTSLIVALGGCTKKENLRLGDYPITKISFLAGTI